ncbi:nucleotide-binding protein [Thalassovita mangrovi]|uniref:Nucleotide-binding protein n=1 Tax=Thalassovita mangrovi TaxID=2692236 RepID=A0A6L8LQY2_9RHOB|nr:nucleotide-binding protein [Thalassovita mangrovi]MYM56970.1 nucleotide-binding protein [Thalassovita mangrovi]
MHFISKLVSAAGLALLLAVTAHAETVSPKETSYYVGETVTVEGVVSQVSTSNRGTTFINFGGRYPNHIFYAVIFKNNADRFSGVRSLEGKAVAITGAIELYKGKPQIILRSPSQIELRN